MTKEVLEKLVKHLINKSTSDHHPPMYHVHVIDVFTVPRYVYRVEKKAFELIKATEEVLGMADAKIDIFCERYDMMKQRILRTDVFQHLDHEEMKVIKLTITPSKLFSQPSFSMFLDFANSCVKRCRRP
jgi:hypothetical protein